MRIEFTARSSRAWSSVQGMRVHYDEFASHSCYIAQYFVCAQCHSVEPRSLHIWEPRTALGMWKTAFQAVEMLHTQ